jgi:peptidoglycan/xylan/chitin deacetylase (PgdA/CDA1 family)
MQLVSGALWSAVAGLGVAACLPADLDHDARIYNSDDPAPYVVCSANIDDKYDVPDFEIEGALVHARDEHSTVHFYAHDPGTTIALSTIEYVLSTAVDLGVPFVTYDALGSGGDHGSLALSFDDNSVSDWTAMRPLLARYGARVTFFVTRYLGMTDDERAQLHQLAADGHDIEYHTVSHLNAVDYVTAHGLDAYVADEIEPALTAMRDDGFTTREFAYPFGARSADIDAALAPYFDHLRAIRTTCPRSR